MKFLTGNGPRSDFCSLLSVRLGKEEGWSVTAFKWNLKGPFFPLVQQKKGDFRTVPIPWPSSDFSVLLSPESLTSHSVFLLSSFIPSPSPSRTPSVSLSLSFKGVYTLPLSIGSETPLFLRFAHYLPPPTVKAKQLQLCIQICMKYTVFRYQNIHKTIIYFHLK